MTESLNVIGLISGGKDSFFSLLHCIRNGHEVVALGNLYPAPLTPAVGAQDGASHEETNKEDEHDLNSFMYQTVGHTVIPLYEKALGMPLYRQPIVGSAVQTGTSYSHLDVVSPDGTAPGLDSTSGSRTDGDDETESLVPLLKRIMAEHPEANALSTGAILSTYQRTRIESVALRLGLTPLSYLWKYSILPPGTQISLLQDVQDVGLDARIVKVASGGLDESFLWENVGSQSVIRRVERAMKRFGTDGDGSVLGEGGEFETLVVDGPASLFKGRIEIQEKDRRVVREGGGSAWLRILEAKVTLKNLDEIIRNDCRIPDLLEPRFSSVLDSISKDRTAVVLPGTTSNPADSASRLGRKLQNSTAVRAEQDSIIYWTVSAKEEEHRLTISEEASNIIEQIRQLLTQANLEPGQIISTVIVLRSMQDFGAVNKEYGALFTKPNPPARVTISCGESMPNNTNIIIYLKIHNTPQSSSLRKALHVQSRSYWAPANIGPYSQAISILLPSLEDQESKIWTASVAGQIPLIPSTMILPPPQNDDGSSNPEDLLDNFKLQTVLSLQHLWRIGEEMDVQWWTSIVAYLPRGPAQRLSQPAQIAGQAWTLIHRRPVLEEDDENDESRDLWEEKNYAGMENRGGRKEKRALPDWEIVESVHGDEVNSPPFFAVEVEELPRGAGIEWHAHLGVTDGPIKLYSRRSEDGWTIYQCAFGNAVQSVIMIDYAEDISSFSRRLEGTLESLGLDSSAKDLEYASYLDVSVERISSSREYKGLVPCRSIWDIAGRRLAAVLLLDIT